ncbi:MAG: tetratricopeptide repeat protein [Phycisphaerales bacterium]|nr:tetratricopeptide repeat protein [Phycisphaerales bacterium]MCB9862115.1 tetratricopeptide repeat protein [Phycisphaerales bacterium]
MNAPKRHIPAKPTRIGAVAVLFAAGVLRVGELRAAIEPAGAASFASARSHFLHGQYDEAIAEYDALAATPADAVRAACEARRIHVIRGTLDDGIARLKALSAQGEKSADWHAALADLYDRKGMSEQAIEHAQKAIRIDVEHLEAPLILGHVYERLGRYQDAMKTYVVFDDLMTSGDLPSGPESLTTLGRGFYRYTVLTQQNVVQRVRHILREVYQEAFDFVDKEYWPARLAAGDLLLDRHNLADAAAEFDAILKQNPNVPDALVGQGRVQLEQWDFEAVENRVSAALAVNPNHVGAHLLLGDCRITERRFADAAEQAEKALGLDPESLEAMGLLAGAKLCMNDKAAAQRIEDRAASLSKAPAAFYFAVGEILATRRQYDEAHDYLTRATKAAPFWPAPFVELGLLCMESGREAEARKALEAAHEIDSFNQRTFDVLGLLDEIEKFDRFETEHFVIKFDRNADAIAAPYFADALERCYGEICTRYAATPEGKTTIEMFPTHEGFSLRVSHRPFIATIGACTGPVIAIMAPRGRAPFGSYNWADVLRHEFTHTVTLAATRNRIPHWLTEGLAVFEEPAPREWGRLQMLTGAVRRDQLFKLDDIDMGFMRPRFPESRSLAYAQSEWMVEYIEQKYGLDAVRSMLAAFREGDDVDAAFRKVLKTAPAEFDAAFKQWAGQQTDEWNLPWLKEEKVPDVQKLLVASPDDASLIARLAAAHFIAGDHKSALFLAQRAIVQNRDEPIALEVIGRILIGQMLAEQDTAKRRKLIDEVEPSMRRLRRIAPDNGIALLYLGYVEQAWEQWPEAIDLFAAYQTRYPADPDSYRRLAAIYKRQRNDGAALKQLERLAELQTDDPFVLKQIAQMHADNENYAQAKRYWIAALNVSPFDVDIHGALADACLATDDLVRAKREFRAVADLLPDDPIGFEGLAEVFRRQGNSEKADSYAQRARALGGAAAGKHEPPVLPN